MAKQPKISESQLQSSFFKWFRAQYVQYYWNCYSIPNGGNRTAREGAKMKREGTLSGVWDVKIDVPRGDHVGMWIEFKIKGNTLSDNQKDFKENSFTGYRWEVCYTLEAAIEVVRDYFSNKIN